MPAGPRGQSGQLGAWILPRQPTGCHWWGCWHGGRPGAAPSTLHSCLQKLFSGGGRSRPSMARRWTMCFWMTSRQRVCREGTGKEQKEAAELAELPGRLRTEGCGGVGPRGSPGAPCFRTAVGELALWQEQALPCPRLEPAAPAGMGSRGPGAVKLFGYWEEGWEDSYVPKLCVTMAGLHLFSLGAVERLPGVSRARDALSFHPAPLVCFHRHQCQAARWAPVGRGCATWGGSSRHAFETTIF